MTSAGAAPVVVIGGGIAGLSVAFHLARWGAHAVQLFEREPALCGHSSGRNAAIYRQLADNELGVALAQRTAQLLDQGPAGLGPWLRTCGGLYVAASPEPLDRAASLAMKMSLSCERLSGHQLVEYAPVLADSGVSAGLLVPGDGVIDIHSVTEALARGARERGVRIQTNCGVEAIVAEQGRVAAVVLEGGRRVACRQVVIAAGAWASSLGAALGVPLPMVPMRRHLAVLDIEDTQTVTELPE